jgi:hypothetical protein
MLPRIARILFGLEEVAARMLFETERPKVLMSDPEKGNLGLPSGEFENGDLRSPSAGCRRASGPFFTALTFFVHFWVKPKMHVPFRFEIEWSYQK